MNWRNPNAMQTPSEDRSDGSRPARRGVLWSVLRWSGLIALALMLVFGSGLLLFINGIAKTPPRSDIQADGIVVLTGGDSRVSEAVRLLAAGHGHRLLISGVHPETTTEMLRRINPAANRLFDCCIDLDRNARDTIENADETRRWLTNQGFRSVIVVTSSYHMPRGLVELRRALPELKLVPYPVVPTRLRLDAWWAHPGTFRLLASEYVKYLASLVRCSAVRLMAAAPLARGIRACLDPVSG